MLKTLRLILIISGPKRHTYKLYTRRTIYMRRAHIEVQPAPVADRRRASVVCMYTRTIYINLYISSCGQNRFCSIFTVASETYKLIWGVKKLLHGNVLWRFDPLLLDIYRIPPYIHFDVTIRVLCFLMPFFIFDDKYRGF